MKFCTVAEGVKCPFDAALAEGRRQPECRQPAACLGREKSSLGSDFSFSMLYFVFYAPHGLHAVFSFAECREAQVALAARTESHSGGADYVGLIEQLFEKTP